MRDDHASGNLFATESADDGMTWSRPEMTDIPDAKAKSAVVNLSDGRVVLVSNPILELRRRVLTVLVSDNGKVFDRGAILHEHKAIGDARPRGNAGWQYPSAVEHNGNLWLTCSETKHDIIVAQIPIRALP
jgi:predicted neuraminidase